MLITVVGLLVFIALHSLRGHFPSQRERLIDKFGLVPFRIIFSIATLAALTTIGFGLSLARQDPVSIWQPDPRWRIGMSYGMLIVALGFTARWVPGTYLRRWLRQPVLLAIVLWAILHLLVAGALYQILVFVIMLAWSMFALWRDRHEPQAVPVSWIRDLIAIVLAVIIWYGFGQYLHASIIGMPVVIF